MQNELSKIKVFIPVQILHGNLFPFPYRPYFERIKEAGIDGVKLLLTKYVITHAEELAREAHEHGLEVRFHRWWPTFTTGWHNWLVTPFFFPQLGFARVDEVLPYNFNHPTVLSTYDAESFFEYGQLGTYALMQPACTGQRGQVVPFRLVLDQIRWRNLRIVFDIGHWLQYHFWPEQVPDDASFGILHDILSAYFSIFQKYICELHVYGVDTFTATGMNRWPDDPGRIHVFSLLADIAKRGWRGPITYEVAPSLIKKDPGRLRTLREFTDHTFK